MAHAGELPAAAISTPLVNVGSWYIATPFQGPLVGAAMSILLVVLLPVLSVGAWMYEPELSPEKTTVSAEPSAVGVLMPLWSWAALSSYRIAAAEGSGPTCPVNSEAPREKHLPLSHTVLP